MELEHVNEEPAGNAEQEGCTIHIHRGEALSPIGKGHSLPPSIDILAPHDVASESSALASQPNHAQLMGPSA